MTIEALGLSHVAIECSDLEKSLAFYRDTLGFEPYAALGGAAKLSIGNNTFVELFPLDGSAADGRSPIKHFSVAVESIESAAADLTAMGVEVRGPFTLNADNPELPTRAIAFINGPDGEEIEFVEPVSV
jgi:catechol 2,3-dioxygenase-like lactoylglutathione lyase family enzyme